MKGIQEFLKDLKTNEELAKKFKGVEKAEDIVKLAKENGYEFTEDDYMDAQMDSVSGGFDISSLLGKVKDAVKDDGWRYTEDNNIAFNKETGKLYAYDNNKSSWEDIGTIKL